MINFAMLARSSAFCKKGFTFFRLSHIICGVCAGSRREYLSSEVRYAAQSSFSRADVRYLPRSGLCYALRWLSGRLYLYQPRSGLRQRADRQHRASERSAPAGRLGRVSEISHSDFVFRARDNGGGVHPHPLPQFPAAALAAAGAIAGDRVSVRRRLPAAHARPAGKCTCLVRMCHAGAYLP